MLAIVLVDKTTKHMRYLKDEINKLANYGIEDGSTLYLILRLRGGGPGGGSFALESNESLDMYGALGQISKNTARRFLYKTLRLQNLQGTRTHMDF